MTLRPLPGVGATTLIGRLQDAHAQLETVRGSFPLASDRYIGYLRWANGQVRVLRTIVTSSSVDTLVTTPRHWVLQTLDPSTMGNTLGDLVDLEIEQQLTTFDGAVARLRDEARRHAEVDVLFVLDTNALIHTRAAFDHLPWGRLAPDAAHVRLVIPLVVIDELDGLKRRGQGKVVEESRTAGARSGAPLEDVRSRARTTLRTLDLLFDEPAATPEITLAGHETSRVSVAMHIEERDHVRFPDADSEIIDQALEVGALAARPVKIVTSDTGMALRARAAGLETVQPPD